MFRFKFSHLATVGVCVTLLSGCSTTRDILTISDVKPWQRGALAGENMQLVSDPLEQGVDEHIYFSKEASSGGARVQGGGCGCN